jgi:tetratricopeptide (TPR) repeat protein
MARYIVDYTRFNLPNEGITERMRDYTSHLQNMEYANNLQKGMESSAKLLAYGIASSNKELASSIAGQMHNNTLFLEKSFTRMGDGIIKNIIEQNTMLSNVIENGFDTIGSQINELSDVIINSFNKIGSLIDNRLLELIRSIDVSNQKLDLIILAGKVPDFQKERIYYIEQGFKYLKNSVIDRKRMSDCIEYFEKAIQLEKRDYLINYQLGSIYLYYNEYFDIKKAIYHLELAADYADDEVYEFSSKSLNPFQGTSFININKLTYDSYYNLAFCHYLNKDLKQAEESINSALKFIPKNLSDLEIKYFLSEILILQNKDEKAVNILGEIFNKNHLYIIYTASNPNLSLNKNVINLINRFTKNYKSAAEEDIQKCKKFAIQGTESNKALEQLVNDNINNGLLGYFEIINRIGLRDLPLNLKKNILKLKNIKESEDLNKMDALTKNRKNLFLREDFDELLFDTANLIVSNQLASVALVQRKMKIGYNRAVEIIKQLHEIGIIELGKGKDEINISIQDENELSEYFNVIFKK